MPSNYGHSLVTELFCHNEKTMSKIIPLKTGTDDMGTRPSLDGKIPPTPH